MLFLRQGPLLAHRAPGIPKWTAEPQTGSREGTAFLQDTGCGVREKGGCWFEKDRFVDSFLSKPTPPLSARIRLPSRPLSGSGPFFPWRLSPSKSWRSSGTACLPASGWSCGCPPIPILKSDLRGPGEEGQMPTCRERPIPSPSPVCSGGSETRAHCFYRASSGTGARPGAYTPALPPCDQGQLQAPRQCGRACR